VRAPGWQKRIAEATPGLWFTDDFAAERQDALALAREVNEYAARLLPRYR